MRSAFHFTLLLHCFCVDLGRSLCGSAATDVLSSLRRIEAVGEELEQSAEQKSDALREYPLQHQFAGVLGVAGLFASIATAAALATAGCFGSMSTIICSTRCGVRPK